MEKTAVRRFFQELGTKLTEFWDKFSFVFVSSGMEAPHHRADAPLIRFFRRQYARYPAFGNGGNPVAEAEYFV
jgi:hypothetical protein